MNYIKITDHSDYVVVSLNRPEIKNAFHPAMIKEITDFFTKDLGKKPVILKGEGSTFCAGADLNWMRDMINYSLQENIEDAKNLWSLFSSIKNNPAPILAVVEGSVFGGALGLLACADYVIAHDKTQFCFSETRLGLVPAVISDFICEKIPDAQVRPLMMSAEVFSAERALQIGLVSRLSSELPTAQKAFELLANNGFEAMCATKKLLNQLSNEKKPEIRKEFCTGAIAERRVSHEAQVKLKKFLERKSVK